MTTTTLGLVQYYANLLIIQYASKPRAYATIEAQVTPALIPQVSVQTITFAEPPESGTYVLTWDEQTTVAIDWDASAAEIQTELRTLIGLGSVTVTGSAADGFTVTFVDVTPPAALLEVSSSTIAPSEPVVTETDEVILIAVQNGFNLDTAVGAQLDTLGKYVGAARTAQGITGPITLGDADYRSLIRMAVVTNSSQSDLASIQDLIHTFFPDQMRVYDYQNMQMSYLISSEIGSSDLIEMFIVQELLPRPMAVQISVIYAPDINHFFGFCSYEMPDSPDVTPFNDYLDYDTDAPWITFQMGIFP